MNWLSKALSSSVGKKFVMGITGLLLCGFLVAHLAGNLLLYVGPEAYNHYAETLHSNEGLIKVAEVGLVVLFLAHIALAIRTSQENRAARRTRYEKTATKIEGRNTEKLANADTWMLISGAIVLAFILLHLFDFTFEARGDIDYESHHPFSKAVAILQTPVSFWVYVVGCVVLGAHLSHGFSSAFRSLGLSHPKYDPCIKWFGVIFAIVIALGFASFPIWAGFQSSLP